MSPSRAEIQTPLQSLEGNQSPEIVAAIKYTASAIVKEAAKVQFDQNVLIWFDGPGAQLVKEINAVCGEIGAETKYFWRDFEGDAVKMVSLDEEGIRGMFDEEAQLMGWANNVIIIRNPKDPEAMAELPQDKLAIYKQRYSEVHQGRLDGTLEWTLFLWPTEYEAEKEGLPYEEYFRIYMEACNQPWTEIKAAQEKLKEKLDGASIIEFHANEDDLDLTRQTHLTMSIEGMTFANSTIDKNYPGSEVFSAPALNSVNGQIFAEGEYLVDSAYLIRDISLRIESGRIVEAHAREGNDELQILLNRNEDEEGFGSRYFGEVALGTNPGLTRRFFNDLLNEKVGGSFHMAIGHCYTFTEYAGETVNVDNGNTEEKTSLHWDLTILMHKKVNGSGGGRVVVDGETIQVDGKFLDSELEILNPQLS